MNKLFEMAGGRKTAFLLLLLIFAGLAMLTGRIEFDAFSEFATWAFGVYALGNGAEHLAKSIAIKESGKSDE